MVGDDVKKRQAYCTPGTPEQTILWNTNSKVDEEKHWIYRSGVGMLLYSVNRSCPENANAVRELTNALDAPSTVAYNVTIDQVHF